MISKAIPINLVGDIKFVPKSIEIRPIIVRNFTQSHIFIHFNLMGGHLLKGSLRSVRFIISEPRFSSIIQSINQSIIKIFHLTNCMFWLVDHFVAIHPIAAETHWLNNKLSKTKW